MRLATLILILSALPAVSGWTQDTAIPIPKSMVGDLARFDQKTNAGREKVLKTMLLERGISYTVESFPASPQAKMTRTVGKNVIVTLGSGPKDLVVCAHYDAVRLDDGNVSKGMVDNAAAVVVLTRLAESLEATRLNHRIRILFTDMEEARMAGSADYVARHGSERIAAVINLDVMADGKLIGFGEPGDHMLQRAVEESCFDAGVKCLGFANFPPGDDTSFRKAGVPAISMCVLDEVEAHQLWLKFNAHGDSGLSPGFTPPVLKNIHSDQDGPNKVSAEAMSTAYNVLLRMIRKLDRLTLDHWDIDFRRACR